MGLIGDENKERVSRNWYALLVYAGQEDAVVRNLWQRIKSMDIEDLVFNVVVPKANKVKVKNGKRVTYEENIYPGYVFVEMIDSDETRFAVRGTPGVIGFVGSGSHLVPVSDSEIMNVLKAVELSKNTKHEIRLSDGDLVKIVDGPFAGHEGKVVEVDRARGRLIVEVSMFGRGINLELDNLQVEKI